VEGPNGVALSAQHSLSIEEVAHQVSTGEKSSWSPPWSWSPWSLRGGGKAGGGESYSNPRPVFPRLRLPTIDEPAATPVRRRILRRACEPTELVEAVRRSQIRSQYE